MDPNSIRHIVRECISELFQESGPVDQGGPEGLMFTRGYNVPLKEERMQPSEVVSISNEATDYIADNLNDKQNIVRKHQHVGLLQRDEGGNPLYVIDAYIVGFSKKPKVIGQEPDDNWHPVFSVGKRGVKSEKVDEMIGHRLSVEEALNTLKQYDL